MRPALRRLIAPFAHTNSAAHNQRNSLLSHASRIKLWKSDHGFQNMSKHSSSLGWPRMQRVLSVFTAAARFRRTALLLKKLVGVRICCSLMFLIPTVTYGISAEWDLDPISGDWNTPANWTPDGVPNGPNDIATFGVSNTTKISLFADTAVNSIVFTAAATSSYGFILATGEALTISGAGIINNSGIAHHFTLGDGAGSNGEMRFTNSASAGNANISFFDELDFVALQFGQSDRQQRTYLQRWGRDGFF
jgi:hypothetical protein